MFPRIPICLYWLNRAHKQTTSVTHTHTYTQEQCAQHRLHNSILFLTQGCFLTLVDLTLFGLLPLLAIAADGPKSGVLRLGPGCGCFQSFLLPAARCQSLRFDKGRSGPAWYTVTATEFLYFTPRRLFEDGC